MRPFFKILVAVHRILPILDVSGAHPMALLSLIYRSSIAQLGSSWLFFFRLFLSISLCRSSIAHLSLIYRSSIAQLGSSWPFFFRLFFSISLGRSSIAHLSLSYRSSAGPTPRRLAALPYTDGLRPRASPLTGPAGISFGWRLRPALSWLDLLGSCPVGAVLVGYED